MPQYPRRKADKDALYSATLAGIIANPADYPSGPGQPFATATLSGRRQHARSGGGPVSHGGRGGGDGL